jgi:hypothetical protein
MNIVEYVVQDLFFQKMERLYISISLFFILTFGIIIL